MSELLRGIFDYRRLTVRRDILRVPLTLAERGHLASLEARFAEPRVDDAAEPHHQRRRFLRADVDCAAMLEVGVERREAHIVNLGAGGMVVHTKTQIDPGELAVVEVRENASGRRLRFPAQAIRAGEIQDRPAVVLAFVGFPTD